MSASPQGQEDLVTIKAATEHLLPPNTKKTGVDRTQANSNRSRVDAEICALTDEIDALHARIHVLHQGFDTGVDVDGFARQYMQDLHVYNDLKDAAVHLLGLLARASECTAREMYARFGVEPDD